MTEPEPFWIVVRSTVNLPGLPRDRVAMVNAHLPDIQRCLRATWLVPLPADQQPSAEQIHEMNAPFREQEATSNHTETQVE